KIRYLSQKNQGASAARNRGIQESHCDYVAFLDADDIWHPKKLELQMEIQRRRPEIGLLGTSTFDWPAPRLPEIACELATSIIPIPLYQFAVGLSWSSSSVVIRKSLLLKAGLFDKTLRCSEDRDLWLRLAEITQAAKLNLPLTGWRFVPGSLSQTLDFLKQGGEQLLRKLDERGAWKGRPLLRRKAYS